jgi:hypothetical protein
MEMNVDAQDVKRPATPVSTTAAPEPQEIKEKESERQPPAEIDPPHESGYGFGV